VSPWLAFLIGCWVGAAVGVLVIGLCAAADRADRQMGLK